VTRKRYLTDLALTGTAAVTHVGQDGRAFVRLAETLFHPQGGGQKADRGTIAGRVVVHVTLTEEGEVNHYLESTDGLEAGQVIPLVVDAEWRSLNTRLHTAGHLVAAVVETEFPQLQGVAGHHWPGEGRVEFMPGDAVNADEVAARLPAALAAAIAADWPVIAVLEPSGHRTVAVGSTRPVGCGGTHLASVGPLGAVALTGVKAKGGKLRVGYDVR
jgi:Ser-tRNA(Ala) deacylase AlaX